MIEENGRLQQALRDSGERQRRNVEKVQQEAAEAKVEEDGVPFESFLFLLAATIPGNGQQDHWRHAAAARFICHQHAAHQHGARRRSCGSGASCWLALRFSHTVLLFLPGNDAGAAAAGRREESWPKFGAAARSRGAAAAGAAAEPAGNLYSARA